MGTNTFDALEEDLSDVKVDAEDVDRDIVDFYKRKVRVFGIKIANYFRPYKDRVLSHMSQTYHKIRDLGRYGAQYLVGNNLQEVDSQTFYHDPEFADEGIGHEMIHSTDDAIGGLKERHERSIEGAKKHGLWFFYAARNFTEGLTVDFWKDITGKVSKSLYTQLGFDKAAKYVRRKYGDYNALRPSNQTSFENMIFDYANRVGSVYAI